MEKVKKVTAKAKKAAEKIDKRKVSKALKAIEDLKLLERLEQVEKLAGSPSKTSKILHTVNVVVWAIVISVGALFNTGDTTSTTVAQEPTVIVGSDTLTVSEAILQLEQLVNSLKEDK